MAISYLVRINGVDRADTNVLYEGFSINEVLNGINTLSCEVESADASFRPLKRQTIEIDEYDGTSPARTIFGGIIKTVRERGFGQPADGIDDIVQNITADDYKVYAQRRFVTATIPAGTLKAALQVIEPYLTAYGVTLDPSQPVGPTLEAIEFEVVRVDDCLNFLAQLTTKYGAPFAWTIAYTKILGMYQTGTVAAPWNLVEGDGTEVGDIEVEPTDDEYANKIIVVFGSGKVITTADTFTTNGIINSFPLTYRLVGPLPGSGFGAVGQAIVVFNGVTATLAEPGLGYEWEYDINTNTVSRAAGPPAAGTLVVPYDGELKGVVIAQDAGEIASVGLWEYKILAPEIEDPALALSVAEAELARRLSTGRIVRFATRRVPGPVPGESITITVPKRNISGVFTVTDVVTESEPGNVYDENASPSIPEEGMLRRVTCDSSIHEQSHQTLTRWWSEKDTNGIALPAGSAGVPAPPLYSIQSNRPLGRFFGEGYLLYYSLFFGGGSPDRNGLIFPGTAGNEVDPWRMEMGMLDEHGDFSMDLFGAGDRGASPLITPISWLMNSAGDFFITAGTSAPNPPVTSPPTEWYWGGIYLEGNNSLTSSYEAAGGFISGGFAPGFQLIPGPYGDSVANFTGFNIFASVGYKFHPIDGIVATLPFTIDTDGVSDTQDYSLYISTAGTGTITLPYVGSSGTPNYHVWPVTGYGRTLMIVNESSGTLTVSGGGANINGDASIALGPYSSVIVSRFNVTATGEWAVLASHGSMTGGGGGGTPLTVPGAVKDVLFVGSGATLDVDTGQFTYDKAIDQLALNSILDYSQVRITSGSEDGGVIGIQASPTFPGGSPPGDYYGELTFGRETIAGTDTARRATPAYLWAQDTGGAGDGAGIEINPGETPGNAMTYNRGLGFAMRETGRLDVYQYGGMGTGSITGPGVYVNRNDSGGGAAAYWAMEAKDGTAYFLWVDAVGKLRISTAPPQEDGTPSDTSGTIVGTQT